MGRTRNFKRGVVSPPKGRCMVEQFSWCRKRKVEGKFSGGAITSDGGALLLREVDRRLKVTSRAARLLPDSRRQASCKHRVESLIRQRVYGIALGYEDLNDHERLRHDPCIQTAVGEDKELASVSTLCRFENEAERETAWAMHEVLIRTFIESFKKPPTELTLDFDATDDRVHGEQEGRFFHGYYGNYCFLPLYVYCGDQLLVSYLRQSNQDAAKHAGVILRLLVHRLRAVWPQVKITFRADSGFCRWRTLSWCERNSVQYIVGLAQNNRLLEATTGLRSRAETRFEKSGEKQRLFSSFSYAANSWSCERRVLAKVEHSIYGPNPRFVVTNLDGEPQQLYDELYCARGEMENRIKEAQLGLFADRTSCHHWWPNQLRLLLSSLAYVLVDGMRRIALQGSLLARSQVHTLRLKLFKIGAVIIRNTKTVRFLFSSNYPYQALFHQIVHKLRVT